MAIKQKLSQKTLQKLSPQRIQLMKLIQMPLLDLERKIDQEISENPALTDVEGEEEFDTEAPQPQDDPQQENPEETPQEEQEPQEEREFDEEAALDDYLDAQDDYEGIPQSRAAKDDIPRQIADTVHTTLYDHLMQQLRTSSLSPAQSELADYLIGSLDLRGYLARPLSDLADDIAFSFGKSVSVEALEEVLGLIQRFDPPGVACRDLRECLLLQLDRLPQTTTDPKYQLARDILQNSYDLFVKNRAHLLLNKYPIGLENIEQSLALIKDLNPKPGNNYGGGRTTAVIPDYSISIRDEKVYLELNGRNTPKLFVSKSYIDMLARYGRAAGKAQKSQKQAVQFIQQKIDAARSFMDSIYQREQTLFRVGHAIIDAQYDYFLSGNRSLIKPMVLKDIAKLIDMDVSTVSRVVSKKYISTPYGIIGLKELFSEALHTTDSDAGVSSIKVKELIKGFIKDEPKDAPLSDQAMSNMLSQRGVVTARRTVTKYREQLNIPVARLRRR